MSDRRLLLVLLASALPMAARAQTLDELRGEQRRTQSALTASVKQWSEIRDRRQFGSDAEIRAGGRVVRYRSAELPARDSAAIARGLELGIAQLRERFGEAGVALADTTALGVNSDRRRFMNTYTLFVLASPNFTRATLPQPVDPQLVADLVLHQAGDRLVALQPLLRQYAGYSAMLPDLEMRREIARRLATSWAASGRRCAAGAIAACVTVAEPFDPHAATDRYFEPRDYRDVVASAKLPAVTDSLFWASRRHCLDGADTACVRLMPVIVPSDPFGVFLRGSVLSHAIELGGHDAVARLLAARDTAPVALLARTAGTSEDALLSSWRERTFDAVRTRPVDLAAPFLTSVAWGVLLLAAATRRRYL